MPKEEFPPPPYRIPPGLEDHSDRAQIFWRVPRLDSFYAPSDEGERWQEALLHRLHTHPDLHITLVSEGDFLDEGRTLLQDVPRGCVEGFVLQFRSFLRELYLFRQRLSWVATGELSGSYFELALCVSQLQVVSPWQWLGFPAWQYGYPPLAGACELWVEDQRVKKSFWQGRKTFFWQALQLPEEFSVRLICGGVFLDSLQLTSIDSAGVYTAPLQIMASMGGEEEGKWVRKVLRAYDQKKQVTLRKTERFGSEVWELFWRKTKRLSLEDSQSELGEAEKVRDLYLLWQAVSLVNAFPDKQRSQGWYPPHEPLGASREFWVDVSAAFPPVNLVVLWWSLGWQVVCYSASASLLSRRLQIFMQKLITLLGKEEAAVIWKPRLHVCVGSFQNHGSRRSHIVGMQWFLGGEVRMQWQGQQYRFWRLPREEDSEELGWVEGVRKSLGHVPSLASAGLYCEELDHGGRYLAQLLGGGVLESGGVVIFVWLRAQFLLMMLRESAHVKGGWRELVRFLLQDHWRIPEEESQWAEFVEKRLSDKTLGRGSDLWPSSFPWDGSWQDVAYYAQQRAEPSSVLTSLPRYRVAGLMSQHFLLFALFLARTLLEKGYVKGPGACDGYVRQVLGVPSRCGSLFFYGDQVGEGMYLEYQRRYFSDFL